MDHNSKTDLKDFITLSKQRLNDILKRLEWSEEEVLKDFNSNSVASSNKEKIKKVCSPKISSYPDSCFTHNSIVIETNKLQEILQNSEVQAPVNFTQLQANFTREQKLKIYDYVIGNTEKLQHFKEAPVVEGELSLADILAQKKREEKRKKRRFRKSKPTHIEEVRSLVELQMQALQQFMGDKMKKEERSKEDNYARDRSQDKRNQYKEYYNKERNRESFAEQRIKKYAEKANDFRGSWYSFSYERRRRSRSRSKESSELSKRSHREIMYKSERYERSRSRDISPERSRRSRSRSKDRSRSRNKKESYRSKRRSTSRTKDYSKDRRKRSKSQSKERYSQRNKYDYYQEQHSRRDYDCYYEKDQEKNTYKDKHYRRNSKSPETSNSRKYYQGKTPSKEYYDDRNATQSSSNSNYDGYHKSLSQNIEESPQNKYCKHKKKKHKRERS